MKVNIKDGVVWYEGQVACGDCGGPCWPSRAHPEAEQERLCDDCRYTEPPPSDSTRLKPIPFPGRLTAGLAATMAYDPGEEEA
jgi:hypothetical protein